MPVIVGGRKVTMAEIARKAGVPYFTVWCLLTGGLRRGDDDVRRRVEEALAELAAEGGGADDATE